MSRHFRIDRSPVKCSRDSAASALAFMDVVAERIRTYGIKAVAMTPEAALRHTPGAKAIHSCNPHDPNRGKCRG